MIDEKTTSFEDHKSESLRKVLYKGRESEKNSSDNEKVTDALYRHKKNIYEVYINQNEYLR